MCSQAGRHLKAVPCAGVWEEEIPVKLGSTVMALTALLGSSLYLSPMALPQTQQAPASVPDAPAPQAPQPLTDMGGPITHGEGAQAAPAATSDSSTTPGSSSTTSVQPPATSDQPAPTNSRPAPSLPLSSQAKDDVQATPPDEGASALTKYVVNVNFVEVPVTVKDTKGNLVAGLTQRDFKVFENNTRYPLRLFSVDPRALSRDYLDK